MKTIIANLAVFIVLFSNTSVGQVLNDEGIFFSYKSRCNIKVEIKKNGTAEVLLNGKSKQGKISADKYTAGFFDFIENGTVIFIFSTEEDKIIIENQKYQFDCEDAKFIELGKISDDKNILREFTAYASDNPKIWSDIVALNDKAYYLEQLKCYETAAFILEKVVAKNPERTVAWLNLGDVYWELGKKEESKKAYAKYVELMKSQKKDLKKIPKNVYKRIN